jgi:PQQ-like domain
MRNRVCSFLLVVITALASFLSSAFGQQAFPSTKNGEWPQYTADLKGSRYSPLDQIKASNFSKLEVAWRFKTDSFGPRPEYKLEGTPLMIGGVLYATAGTRRSVIALDAKTGELIWAYSLREGNRAAVAPRQLSGRGLAYWTDGRGDDRVLYVTTGYRLIALNAHTGRVIPSFGENGMVDLKKGVVYGTGQQIDLETGEIGVHSTPIVVKDTVIIGSSMKKARHRSRTTTPRDWFARSMRAAESCSGPSIRFPARVNLATTRGRTARGLSTEIPASGPRSRWTKISDWFTCRWNRRHPTGTGDIDPATIFTARAWCAWT